MTTTLTAPLTVNHPRGIIWENGALTDLGEQVYTAGDCWALAWELAEVTGGELTLLLPDRKNFPTLWYHVAVKLGDDLYLDATGLHTRLELEAEWNCFAAPYSWVANDFYSYREALGAEWNYGNARRETRKLAGVLVASLGLKGRVSS